MHIGEKHYAIHNGEKLYVVHIGKKLYVPFERMYIVPNSKQSGETMQVLYIPKNRAVILADKKLSCFICWQKAVYNTH